MNSNAFSAADMSTAAASGHRDGYQAGYADAVKAFDAAQPAAAQEAAWGVYAKSDEYPEPILIPEYAGSIAVIQSRLMDKARSEGFIGDFEQRMDDLGWGLEPLFRAAPVAAAPVERYEIQTENGPLKCSLAVYAEWQKNEEYIERLKASTPAAPGIDLQSFRQVVMPILCPMLCARDAESVARKLHAVLIDASPKGGSDELLREVRKELEADGVRASIGSMSPMESLHGRIAAHLERQQATSAEVGA